jgi:hypothetical protein
MMVMRLFFATSALFLAACMHTYAASVLPVVDLGYEIHQAFSLNVRYPLLISHC